MENIESPKGPKDRELHVSDYGMSFDGLDIDKADSTGRVAEDLAYREDDRRHGMIRTEHTETGKRLWISGGHRDGHENTRADKLAEENAAAVAFANDLSKRMGKDYLAEPKKVENSTFPDVWIQERGSRERFGVEFTHFEEEAIEQLQAAGKYNFELTVDRIGQHIRNAIAKKNSKMSRKSPSDQDLTTKIFLVLISPFPIRPSLYEDVAAMVNTPPVEKMFMETWVLPLQQKPFRVQ